MEENAAPSSGGVFGSILIFLAYVFISVPVRAFFPGTASYFVDSALRAVFGAAALFLFVKHFQKENWTNVIHFKHFKEGLFASIGIILLILFLILRLATGAKAVEITAQMALGRIFLQQFTTGFWEEMVFRAYLMEGYYSAVSSEERTWKDRLYYAFVSGVIFGMLHMFGNSSPLLIFAFTGAFGFIMASVYLHSHNILVCMLGHFIYDIFANYQGFVTEWDGTNWFVQWYDTAFWTLLGIAFFIAIIYIVKKPADE